MRACGQNDLRTARRTAPIRSISAWKWSALSTPESALTFPWISSRMSFAMTRPISGWRIGLHRAAIWRRGAQPTCMATPTLSFPFETYKVPFWFGPKASGYCIGFANPDAPKTEEERLAVVAKSTGDKWAIVDLPPYMRQFLDQPVMFDGVEIGTSQENQTSQYGHWFMRMFNVFMSAEAGDPIMVRYGGRTEAERAYHQRLGNGHDDKQALAEHKYVQAFIAWARNGRPEGQEPQLPDQDPREGIMPKMNLISGEPVNRHSCLPKSRSSLPKRPRTARWCRTRRPPPLWWRRRRLRPRNGQRFGNSGGRMHEKARQEEKQGAEAKAAALAEERYRVSVQWAQAGRARAINWLRAALLKRADSPSAKARAYVLRYEQTLDGWQSTVKLYESREPFYRMNDRWADILLATQNYPSDKENRYYWNKKGMPKIKALRKWTDIQVTRRDRNGLWTFPEEADKWI